MGTQYWCFLLAAVILVYLPVSTFVRQWRRARELRTLAKRLGLTFVGLDEAVARQSGLPPFLRSGASLSYDALLGDYQGHRICVLNHRAEFFGWRPTRVHAYGTYIVLEHEGDFPELSVWPARHSSDREVMRRLGEMHFKSVEFAQSFRVAAADRKFASDVCHPRMMEYLLEHRDLLVEIKGNSIALGFQRHLRAGDIPARLNQLVEIRKLMPEYLFDARTEEER